MHQADDALSQILSPMRIMGSVLLAERYTEPWGIAIPDTVTLARMLGISDVARVVVFHLACQGAFDILYDGTWRTVSAGELMLCVGGAAHTVGRGKAQVVALQSILSGAQPCHPLERQPLQLTTLICGAFTLQDTQLNPLFDALPAQMHITVFGATHHAHPMTVAELCVAEVMQQRQGRHYAVERYLELLCVEAFRAYMTTDLKDARGWFRGMQDPLIATTLTYIQQHPDESLSVPHLAERINLSPSRFAARFRNALQQSPMAYIATWRLYRASVLLKQRELGVEDVALQVGYHDFAAFARAFKRHFGKSPTIWRALAIHDASRASAR